MNWIFVRVSGISFAMRIIAGKSGGIPIKVPKETTRPTTDRVRESVFSSLGMAVIDAEVLDLYAGSGSLGLESLSRGAKSATFVDGARAACKTIEANLVKTGLGDHATVRSGKVEGYLRGLSPTTKFDLIFADPPYAKDESLTEALDKFLNHENLPTALNAEGMLVLETYSRNPLPHSESWLVVREKIYGETRVTYLTAIKN